MDVLDGAHGPVTDAFDHRPAVIVGGGSAGAAAGGQIVKILFVDVGAGVGGGLPGAHQLLGEVRGHIQIDDQIGAGKAQLVVLEFVEPL